MIPAKNDFKDLLGSVGQLEERRQKIEDLRNEYFRALEGDDVSGQKRAIAEAERQGVELLQNLPLSDLKEFSQLRDMREKVAEIRSLLQNVNLDELKRTDVSELQRKSEELKRAIEDLKRLTEQIPDLADQASRRMVDARNLQSTMSQAQEELQRQQATLRNNLTVSRILGLRQRIDSLTLAQFEQQAVDLSLQVQNERTGLEQERDLAVEQHQELDRHLSEISGQLQWLRDKKKGYFNDDDLGLVRKVEQQIRDHRSVEENDLTRLQELWSEPNLPACVIRILSQAREDQVTSARTLDQESRQWWRDFVGIAEPQASLASKKQRLETLRQKIDASSVAQIRGNDIEIWLAWRKRVQKAQDLMAYLAPMFNDGYGGSLYRGSDNAWMQPGMAPTNPGPGMNRLSTPAAAVVRPDLPGPTDPVFDTFWRRLWDLLEDSPDEVLYLCVDEWKQVFDHLLTKLPPERQQLLQFFEGRATLKIKRCRQVFGQFGQSMRSR